MTVQPEEGNLQRYEYVMRVKGSCKGACAWPLQESQGSQSGTHSRRSASNWCTPTFKNVSNVLRCASERSTAREQ